MAWDTGVIAPLLVVSGLLAQTGTVPTPTTPPPPVRTDSAISGTVIDGVTRQPIADAIVQLGWPRQREYPDFVFRQFTDSRGRFVFTDLPAGDGYVVTATKSGYFGNAFGASGRQNSLGPPIQLADGQWFSTATLALWPPASISGIVTDEQGEPSIGVFVRLLAQVRVGGVDRWAAGQVVLTDDRGIYRIGQLPGGKYFVMVPSVQASVPATAGLAEIGGFSPQQVESSRAAGRPLPSVDPIVDADAGTRIVVNGYPVPPPPVEGRSFAYPMAFAGGRSIGQATAVVVEAGTDRSNVNIRLEPVPAVRVSGVVDGPPDARANLFLRLLVHGLEDLGWGGEAATAITGPDGSFTFANVPAGEYTIDAPTATNEYTIGSMGIFYVPNLPRPPGVSGISRTGGGTDAQGFGFVEMPLGSTTLWARTPVSVGGRDATGIVVSLRPTMSVGGRLVAEPVAGVPEPASPPRFMSLQSATGSPWQGIRSSVSTRNVPAGEFRIDGLVAGEYLFDGGSNTGWMVKSVRAGGRDYTYTPIDLATSVSDVVVTFTNALPEVSGIVTADTGAPAANVIVIAYPVESAQWTNIGIRPLRIRTTQTSTAGAFRLSRLPAGSYNVVAIPAARLGAWREPGFFQRAAGAATNVAFDWGEKKSITVRLADVR